jgi:hypothetical protein
MDLMRRKVLSRRDHRGSTLGVQVLRETVVKLLYSTWRVNRLNPVDGGRWGIQLLPQSSPGNDQEDWWLEALD